MKPPAFPFYVRDWLTDTELSRCSPATRGIWIDLLAAMWVAPDRGRLAEMTFDELARTARCTAAEAETAVEELERTGTASVTRYKSVTAMLSKVTVECRRMVRDENERNSNAERQKRYRENKACPDAAKSNAKVTPPLASASSSASSSAQILAAKAPAKRAPNPYWDAVVDLWKLNPVTETDRKRVGKLARDFKAKCEAVNAGPAEIAARHKLLASKWGDADMATPEALCKWWDSLKTVRAQTQSDAQQEQYLRSIGFFDDRPNPGIRQPAARSLESAATEHSG